MSIAALASSFSIRQLLRGLASPLFWLCWAAGFCGLLFKGRPLPDATGAWLWFIISPFVEELTWRTLLQDGLSRHLSGGNPVTVANLVASAGFAAAHLAVDGSLMAALTFFPSLVFGILWSRFHSTLLCGMLHLWYNVALRL